MGKLALMPMIERIISVTPAVMYEREAAKYLKLGIHEFRRLVNEGAISFTTHRGRTRRIYVKEDLDTYLRRLPRSKMSSREDSPSPTDWGTR